MPPDAFTFDTSGQLVMQTAIGGAGTLFGPLVGAAHLALSQRLPPEHAASRQHLEARARRGLRAAGRLPASRRHRRRRGPDRARLPARGARRTRRRNPTPNAAPTRPSRRVAAAPKPPAAPARDRRRSSSRRAADAPLRRPVANRDIDFSVRRGRAARHHRPERRRQEHVLQDADLRGAPYLRPDRCSTSRDITGWDVTGVCQLGLTKSYQVNQLFNRLTVRENVAIAALAQNARAVPRRPAARRGARAGARRASRGDAGAGAT